ncbi:MAG: M23 family metallopeptidase [Candidatus Cloacimonetes bacterium]|nr:M23 family metallopeptidase [Candidatus Cloacimonadota bacterium]MCF7814709.1 M23 family metallopeptidase [Candidatus Cloacimonadota bacterium]MCF7868170.1 M23 family metallopeptidase [Candidatus Cloacimonadota bacterium]MCF7884478.1 M23 family metallopeptidase [Candidatus Cloacimonadota bacterium]
MNTGTKTWIKLGIFLIMLIIIVIDFFVIRYLQKKMDNITIITYQDSTLLRVSPKSLNEPTILVTQQFVDKFNHYKSPFNDGMTFDQLIDEYIRNRWSDHYGCVRGTAEKKRIHEGIDLFVPENTPVYPLTDYGIVTEASDNPHYLVEVDYKKKDGSVHQTKIEYGKTVRILYPEGIESIYTHLNEVYVQAGQEVNSDTIIGLTGLTGNIRNSGKASHLHLELRDKNNRSFDPRHRLRFDQGSLEFFLEHLKLGE